MNNLRKRKGLTHPYSERAQKGQLTLNFRKQTSSPRPDTEPAENTILTEFSSLVAESNCVHKLTLVRTH